jgi:hypothetical protein
LQADREEARRQSPVELVEQKAALERWIQREELLNFVEAGDTEGGGPEG